MTAPSKPASRTSPERKQKKRTGGTPVRVLARQAIDALLDKKGRDVVVMDMRKVSGVADYFVLCTGDSDLQIKALTDAVEERLRERCQERPWHREGYEHRQWVLIDYVDLVVHIFTEEKRAFYDLERLWGDAPSEQVPEDGSGDTVQLLRDADERPQP
ncbi:MAG: ribosomal silencing factor RsfS [Rhodothermaceae bacterium]|nr:MAG: ribosomal silencing factor RsfS [Rhodothermaceae bacterium]